MDADLRLWIKDTGERVVVTFVISILAVVAGSGITDWDADTGKKILSSALVAAAVVIKQAVWPKSGSGLSPALDVLARATWSAVQHVAILVSASAGFDWYSVTAWQTALVAGIAAAASVIKGALALRMHEPTITPASLAPVGHDHV